MSEINEKYYLNEKYDLEEILNPLYNTKQKYYEWCIKRDIEDYSLIFVIDQIKASCLGPACLKVLFVIRYCVLQQTMK